MKLVSTLALSIALAAGSYAAPALAQKGKAKAANAAAPAAPQQRKLNFSKEGRKALLELQTAVKANAPDVPQKLAAARAAAKNTDDRYFIAKMQLENAMAVNDPAAQRAAVEAILASGGAEAAETATLNEYLAGKAAEAGDYSGMEATYAARLAANPNDVPSIVNLARAKMELKKSSEALDLLTRAITLTKASGKTGEESWYRNAVSLAHDQKKDAIAYEYANEALKHYPNKDNFNNLIALSQPLIAKDEEAYVDLLRLMQITGHMRGSTDYLRLAQHHEFNRNWGEAKTVLEAAAKAGKTSAAHSALLYKVSARIAADKAALPSVEPKARAAANGGLALSLASVYAGYQDYAKATDLYQVALQKGGVDANLVNTRLAIVQAMAGQRAAAATTFRKVTGVRAPLANLWLAWLSMNA